jgi:hypothetical protein
MSRKPRKIIETAYGKVYEDVLEHLEENFDTGTLLAAAEHAELVMQRIEDIHHELLALYSMADVVINQGYATTRSRTEETIDELAWWLTDELLECEQALDKAYHAVKPL